MSGRSAKVNDSARIGYSAAHKSKVHFESLPVADAFPRPHKPQV